MDSPFANKAFADQSASPSRLLSDWGGEVTQKYGIYIDKYKAARRVNFLIGKDGTHTGRTNRQRSHRSHKNRGRLRAPETRIVVDDIRRLPLVEASEQYVVMKYSTPPVTCRRSPIWFAIVPAGM